MPSARALQVASAMVAVTRTMDIADLLSGYPESRGEGVRPEPFIKEELLPETVVLPFGIPGYMLVQRQGEAQQGLVKARRPRPGRHEQRAARSQLAALGAWNHEV